MFGVLDTVPARRRSDLRTDPTPDIDALPLQHTAEPRVAANTARHDPRVPRGAWVECSRLRTVHSNSRGSCSSVALADVGAVERALLVQAKVPFAGGMLAVIVEPDFGAVVGLAAVDVEELLRVVHSSDPVFIVSRADTKSGGGCFNTYQYWPLPFLRGMI